MRNFLIFFTLVLFSTNLFGATTAKSIATQYLKGKLEPSNIRYKTFAKALQLMKKRGSKIIVETGTTRGIKLSDIFNGDGGSTIIFADWASKNNAYMYSVDIEPSAFTNAAGFLTQYQDHLQTVCEDSVSFLASFPDEIDFLYLDSYDYDVKNPGPSQQHHLNEIIAAYPKLNHNSIILIDDCGLPYGGKGRLVVEFLKENGWVVLIDDYQILLVRE